MDFDFSFSQLLYAVPCGLVVPLFMLGMAGLAAWTSSRKRRELPSKDAPSRLEAGPAVVRGSVVLSKQAPFAVRLEVAGGGPSRSQFVEVRGAEVHPFSLELNGGERVEVNVDVQTVSLRDATDEEGADDTDADVGEDETFSVTLGAGEFVIAAGVLAREGTLKPDGFRSDVQAWVLSAPSEGKLELTTGAIEALHVQERRINRREFVAAGIAAPLLAVVNIVVFQKLVVWLDNPNNWSTTAGAAVICAVISGAPLALFGRLLPKRPWYMREQKLALESTESDDSNRS